MADSSNDSPDVTRHRIIQAATDLFGEVGYKRATTRQIAARAGVNEVTVFRHFGNKKNLLRDCVAYVNASGFAETFEQHLTGDYAADILMMAERQVGDMQAGYDLLRLALCDSIDLPEMRQMLQEGARGNAARVTAYFQQQIDAGVVRADLSAEAMCQAFDSLFSWPVMMERMLQTDLTARIAPELLLQQSVAIFVQGTKRE